MSTRIFIILFLFFLSTEIRKLFLSFLFLALVGVPNKAKAVKDFLDFNEISYSTDAMDFDMDNKKRLKLLEESTVFMFCN